ncbi:MAG: helix-turn-helix domain-containing protein [Streptosporangiales bacterium]|nr:helix-turn-helix domain-containing protein [Streptosporangiales bacterium]
MPNNGRGAGLSSVDNALRLLALIGEHQALRVAEAADLLGVARSTAHRLLNSLREHGFVLQDRPGGAYRPGPVLTEIGLTAIGRIDIRRVAAQVMRDLAVRTQETISLSVLEGRDVRFIECVEGTRSVRVGSRTGLALPAHCTAAGKAILSALAPVELDRRYAGRELPARTPASPTDRARLDRELAETRRTGYAVNLEEGEPGISAVGAPIRDLTGAPLGALAIIVPAGRVPDRAHAVALAPAVIEATTQVETLLRAEL